MILDWYLCQKIVNVSQITTLEQVYIDIYIYIHIPYIFMICFIYIYTYCILRTYCIAPLPSKYCNLRDPYLNSHLPLLLLGRGTSQHTYIPRTQRTTSIFEGTQPTLQNKAEIPIKARGPICVRVDQLSLFPYNRG